ncbi:MAG TPA: nucleotidyl transferase AbiEii/AbiGii toxin family protein [Longimicrobium sp.]|nr:nucleotidyl transferase AbiEii/AbiGii toxin family protein [Longimicrobium sp.]
MDELSAAGAEYLLIGAFAIAVHEMPRATGDIDLWIRPDPENARRVWAALASFGAPIDDLTVEELAKPGMFYQIGVAPVRIDFVTEIDGVSFDDAWSEREYHVFEGVTVPVISRRHLLINKKATGRPKDLADVAWLEEGQLD